MINVLFVALEFAPINNTGVYRSLKFVKYLRLHDINPIVLTIDPRDASIIFDVPIDTKLLDELPDDSSVYYLPCDHGSKYQSSRLRSFVTVYFSIKDNLAKRLDAVLLKKLPEIIDKHKPKAIYVSMPPFSAGKLASSISKRYDMPLVIDMRDAWSSLCIAPFGSLAHYYLTVKEERDLFKHASAVVTVTSQLASVFQKTHAGVQKSKFHVIPNGYDSDISFDETIHVASIAKKNEFNIGYIGRFYYDPKSRDAIFAPWWKKRLHHKLEYSPIKEDWLYRSPYFFFKALAALFAETPELKKKVRFKLVGDKPYWIDEMISEFNLENNCFFYGKIPYREVMKAQDSFDALLCTSVKVIGGLDYALASKTFDYIIAKKPIIGFVTKGSQKEFLDKSNVSLTCDPDNMSECIETLKKLIHGGYDLTPNKESLTVYHRKQLSGELAKLIKDVVANKTSEKLAL